MNAVLIGGLGYEPADELRIESGSISFGIVAPDENNRRLRVVVHVQDVHVFQVVLCQCSRESYLVAIWLNDFGRQLFRPEWTEPIKCDIVCSLKLGKHWNNLKSHLETCFGTKFRFASLPEVKLNEDLVYSAILVERYASFLASQKSKNNGSSKPSILYDTNATNDGNNDGNNAKQTTEDDEFGADTTRSSLPDATETIQYELVDDDGDKENLNTMKFGDVTVNLDSIRRCMTPRGFMTGSLATFFLKHYLPNVMLRNISGRDHIMFYDSDCYTLIRKKCEKEIRGGTDGEITVEKAIAMFGRQKKKKNELLPFITDLVRQEVIVMPLFWDSHWILGLLQKYPADGQNIAWTRDLTNSTLLFLTVHVFDGNSSLLHKNAQVSYNGRLIIVDSKFNDPFNKEILAKVAENICYHIFMAIRAALIVSGRKCSVELTLIRCNSLPCQTNNSDCGWFMCAFAEHFTKDLIWMDYSNEDVRHMSLAAEEERKFYNRLTVMKKEIGTYMEKMAGRLLYFNYGK